MGMSLNTVTGVGLLLPLEEGEYGLENPSEWLYEHIPAYSHLSFSVARFGDYVGGAAVFVDRSITVSDGVKPIIYPGDPLNRLTSDELNDLRRFADEFEVPLEPKYITIVSYW